MVENAVEQSGAESRENAGKHTVMTLNCTHEECQELEVVTILEHGPDSKQTELIKGAVLEGAELHGEEAGHGFEFHEEHGDPDAMRERYQELSGEEVILNEL